MYDMDQDARDGAIAILYREGEPVPDMAKVYGISRQRVYQILKRDGEATLRQILRELEAQEQLLQTL